MANSVFIWPGNLTFSGTVAIGGNLSVTGTTTSTGQFLSGDGSATAPGYSFTSQTGMGLFRIGSNQIGIATGTAAASGGVYMFSSNAGLQLGGITGISWTNGNDPTGSSVDLSLFRDAANTLAQRNGTNAQIFRHYGYISGSRVAYGAVQTALASVSVSGASTATGNIIPAGCFVLGIATTTTTTITGASGYTVGDGSDVDRYGDITGTAVGTHSDNTNATANPTGYNAAASAITLTAKTSNFTGGVVQVVAFYSTTGSA